MRPEYREEPCRSALNRVRGMPFEWSLNPYMGCAHRCTFCYVRAFEQRAERPSDERYGQSIRVKTNVAEVLARELGRRSWKRETVVIGAATDPYQPAEGRYRLTRQCLTALTRAATPFSIITRGPLVVRDIGVLLEASREVRVSVNVSIPTLDDALWQATEPGTAPPRQRLRAVRMLADAGIRVAVAIAPVLPGLSDSPESLERVVREAREAGAASLWSGLLYLRPGTREHFLEALGRAWPEKRAAFETLYAGRAYLPKAAQRELSAGIRAMAARHPRRGEPLLTPSARPAPEPAPAARQLGFAF
jgi:DNA repair photolyase